MNSEEMKLYQRNYQREYRRKKREEMKRKRMENYKKEVVNEGGEVILPLKDFPGYCATNYGNIVSMKGTDGPHYLSQRTTKYGYRIVMLSLDGMLKSYQVARLVLSTFVGYPADPWLCVVNHKDGNTENCRLDNLLRSRGFAPPRRTETGEYQTEDDHSEVQPEQGEHREGYDNQTTDSGEEKEW